MGELAVDMAGLDRLAGRCRTWSDDLTEPVTPSVAVPGFSTGMATTEVQCSLDTIARTLAARMRQTAAALQDAAAAYRVTESDSAAELRHPVETS